MSVLSSERPHDQGVEHSMANDRWNDAPAFPAAQTVDNASDDRQCQVDPAASVSDPKYGRHEEHDENLISSFPSQVSPYTTKAAIHQAFPGAPRCDLASRPAFRRARGRPRVR